MAIAVAKRASRTLPLGERGKRRRCKVNSRQQVRRRNRARDRVEDMVDKVKVNSNKRWSSDEK